MFLCKFAGAARFPPRPPFVSPLRLNQATICATPRDLAVTQAFLAPITGVCFFKQPQDLYFCCTHLGELRSVVSSFKQTVSWTGTGRSAEPVGCVTGQQIPKGMYICQIAFHQNGYTWRRLQDIISMLSLRAQCGLDSTIACVALIGIPRLGPKMGFQGFDCCSTLSPYRRSPRFVLRKRNTAGWRRYTVELSVG